MGERPKPENIEFYSETKTICCVDKSSDLLYRVGWCRNGPYCHYVLWEVQDREKYMYVYVDKRDGVV